MLWSVLFSLLKFAAACGVLWAIYTFIFKAFNKELNEMGFNFYGLIGKLLLVASCVYFCATTFGGDTVSLSVQMLIGILVLSPGYVIFFIRCFAKTRNLGYTLVALVFMITISIMAGYFFVMVVMLVVTLLVMRAALASGGGGGSTRTCGGCGKRVRVSPGSSGPYVCPHCNSSIW